MAILHLVCAFAAIALLLPLHVDATELEHVSEHATTPKSRQAAFISRSRVSYLRSASAGAGITVPRTRGVRIKGTIGASVTLSAVLSSDIERCISRLAMASSKAVRNFYIFEKRQLKKRAGTSYFMFFQAAANYGFSSSPYVRKVLRRADFLTFSRKASNLLQNAQSQSLSASISARINIVSNGQRSVSVFFVTNQITLRSGKVLNIVKSIPNVVIGDDKGRVADKNPKVQGKFTWKGYSKPNRC